MYVCMHESKLYGMVAGLQNTKSKKIMLSARMHVIRGKLKASAQYQGSKQSMANMTHARRVVADYNPSSRIPGTLAHCLVKKARHNLVAAHINTKHFWTTNTARY